MKTIVEIEAGMADLIAINPKYDQVVREYYRLLKIMGNVDGDEIIALVMLADENVQRDNDHG
jgi:hypothetical protein